MVLAIPAFLMGVALIVWSYRSARQRGGWCGVAAAAMAAEDPIWKSIYPHTPQQFNDLRYYPYDFYATRWDELIDRWERTVLRAG